MQNQKALLALIFGIAGFVLVSAFIGGFIGIAGIVLGRKARREIDADPQRYTGRGDGHGWVLARSGQRGRSPCSSSS